MICNIALSKSKGVVACFASHFFELPCQTSFCPVFIFFVSLLSEAQHLTSAVVCDFNFLLCVFVQYYCMCLRSHIHILFFY